jgi:dipeptidyl aminopeptidase/acylaminoacyl peptidase
MLFIHGDADETVPLQMSQDFVAALQKAGVKADLQVYPERGHSELLFYTLTQNPGQLITDVVDFANQCP